MICLSGAPALSAFRQQQLLSKLRAIDPNISAVTVVYLYFIDCDQTLEPSAKLLSLLDAGGVFHPEPDGATMSVVPRLGTRSAWSSKATDIAHRCAIDNVSRIERGLHYRLQGVCDASWTTAMRAALYALVHDRMTESVIDLPAKQHLLFAKATPAPLTTINVLEEGVSALSQHNHAQGLALSDEELVYLEHNFSKLQKNPSDAELMMFAQANSEHCRHKIFNAEWSIDNVAQDQSLFAMIRNTHRCSPSGILSAYHDNAAVIEGSTAVRWLIDEKGNYKETEEAAHIQIKVETHNHPTAISPFPGAATGSGGEIRDEGAVGNGSKPKAGLCGFTVSSLNIPDWPQPWETFTRVPERIASPLQIMLEGPVGAASFNNEFGRPNLGGYFRTYCQRVCFSTGAEEVRGYHKPIMIAGGMGNIRPVNVDKKPVPVGAAIIVLGGPSMLIGLGGGAASSVASGEGDSELDYASVQRGNPEMQRRCQEVIDRCIAMGSESPILSIHDVGAGGLSNALPELINDAQRGGAFELRQVLNDEPGMSPMAIWSNESQERYVVAVVSHKLAVFESICQRERCLYAVVGQTTEERFLSVNDAHFNNKPVHMPLEVLLGKPPKLSIDAHRREFAKTKINTDALDIDESVSRVLNLPCVAAKNFLITIGDRSITGQVARDQLVGPWQMPVADVAVTVADYQGYAGEAMAMGERTPIAVINPVASARMAVAESLTNIVAADIGDITKVRLSANWMAASGHPGEDAALFDAVKAVGLELAPALGIAIPVGKDSLSMKTRWTEDQEERSVTAPLSLIVSAFAAVGDVRRTLTPQLRLDCGETELLLIDLGAGLNRLGGSALAQVFNLLGDKTPDVDDPALLRNFFNALQVLIQEQHILAWHDRSDGGLFVTLAEMAFAANSGIRVQLQSLPPDVIATLFNEELGGVLQVCKRDYAQVMAVLERHGLGDCVHVIGRPGDTPDLEIWRGDEMLYSEPVVTLKTQWWQTSYQIQRLRDNPDCAEQELALIKTENDPGISPVLSFDPSVSSLTATPTIAKTRPAVAILRDQGVNGHMEMAAVFHQSGFTAVDVHMSDLVEGRRDLSEFKGLAACGGFSYGDVLGAGGGWANSILYNEQLADMFRGFFERSDTFTLGVCNGCQMLSKLKDLIPGAESWPQFVRNKSEQFEARVATVEVYDSASILLNDMAGSRLPVALAHGEGQAVFESPDQAQSAPVTLGFVDNHGVMTEHYPLNPNGSAFGITGLCSNDGRVSIMMPHPERVYRTVSNSWTPPQWGERGPWLRMFENARLWVN